MGGRKRSGPLLNQIALARRERAVQGQQEFEKALGEVARRIEARGGRVHGLNWDG